MMKILLTGDVMLGRLVDKHVFGNTDLNPAYVWGNTLSLLQQGDLRLINLECVIAQSGKAWQHTPKAFHFRARPRAIEALLKARVDFAGLANNHILDYEEEALIECLKLLDQAKIAHAGAGRNLAEALKPAILTSQGLSLGIISLTDNEPAWKASNSSPGINYVAYDENGLLEPYLSRIKKVVTEIRSRVNFLIICAHVGLNWGKPSTAMIALTHQLINLGADLYWGHSNHTSQGIKVYQNKPILYSTGDFIDDYAVDPTERNDLSFLYELQFDRKKLTRLVLHPTKIESFQVNLIQGSEALLSCKRMQKLSKEFSNNLLTTNSTLTQDF